MIPEEILGFLKKVFGGENDYSKWPQVGKLKPEDQLLRKRYERDCAELANELKILLEKKKLIDQRVQVMSAEWWAHMEKNYSLPRGRTFHIQDDGRILMEPKESN